ncbi:MAG: FKBP-type peptidyl-prolyl cis-trans isomerase, partial [Cyanobium sp.]
MRDILISSAVCVACLLLALVSQLVAPSTVQAAPARTADAAVVRAAAAPAPAANSFELDPEDPNPTLFTMASDASPDQIAAGAADLGGDLVAPKERTTPSGLRITDLVIGDGPEATSGETVSVNYRGTLENGKEFDSNYGRGPFSFPLGAGR